MFKVRSWRAGASIAVHKSQTGNFGRARIRKNTCQTSRLAVREYNRRLSRWMLTLIINTNFLPGDGHVRMHYWKYRKPTPEGAMHYWDVFTKAVRRACKKAGVPFKFVHALGMGERDAMHHHLVVNKEALPIVAALWKYGKTETTHLYYTRDDEQSRFAQNYQGLAWYFCGQDRGENPNPRQKHAWTIWKKYTTSRNLERPLDDTKLSMAEKWEKYPVPEDGYIIDPNSLDLGESPVTGKEYLRYIMLPATPPQGMKGLERERWLQRVMAGNAAEVRVVMDAQYEALEERRRLWAMRDGQDVA